MRANHQHIKPMKKETRNQQTIESERLIRPLAPRESSFARDARGSAGREEIRAKTQLVSAPRESLRPAERSNQKRAHKG